MSEANTPEDRTNELVCVRAHELGGPWFVELQGALDEHVTIGPYDNPAVARDDAKRLRQYLAALLAQQHCGQTSGWL